MSNNLRGFREEIEGLRNQSTVMAPGAASMVSKLTRQLREQGAGTGLSIGEQSPDFTLEDATGNRITLSEELAKGPVILVFYRGEWCPYCNLQLRTYGRMIEEIKSVGAQLIAVSPQTPDHSLSLKEKHALDFHVLSDPGNKTAGSYNLKYKLPDYMQDMLKQLNVKLKDYNGEHSFELPVPATYIIDRNGTIAGGSSEPDHRVRADPSEIVQMVRSLA